MIRPAVYNPEFWPWPEYRRWALLGAALLMLPCSMALIVFNPATTGYFPLCPFRAATGLECPGCGTLRGLHQLFQGNLVAALDLNPLMVLTLPIIGYAFMSSVVFEASGWRLPIVRIPAAWIWGLLVVIVSFWVLRNVPVYPLTVLASG